MTDLLAARTQMAISLGFLLLACRDAGGLTGTNCFGTRTQNGLKRS
jgi:hypothetical protein